jgi:hypothetical protein
MNILGTDLVYSRFLIASEEVIKSNGCYVSDKNNSDEIFNLINEDEKKSMENNHSD